MKGQVQQRRRQQFALGINPQAAACSAAERIIEDEVQRENVRQLVPLNARHAELLKMCLYANCSQAAAKNAVSRLVVGHNADVGMVSFIATAGRSQIANMDRFSWRHYTHSFAGRTSIFASTSAFGTSVGQYANTGLTCGRPAA